LRKDAVAAGTFQVGVMTDPADMTTFIPVETFNPATSTWVDCNVWLNATGLSDKHYVAFKQVATGNGTTALYWMDDLVISLPPTCERVTNLRTTITTTPPCRTVTVTWTPGSDDISWKVEFKEINATTFTERNLVTGQPTDLISGLPSGTYLIRVRANCRLGMTSDWDTTQAVIVGCEQYTITTSVYPTGAGTISPSGNIIVPEGGDQTFTITPTSNLCSIAQVLVNGNNNITAVETGTYTFTDVRQNQTIHAIFTDGCVGIEENELLQDIKIFPNPTTGKLQVTSDKLQVKNVEVLDVLGRIENHLSSVTRYSSFVTLDISHLPSGIYFIRIETNEGTAVRKVIKN